jgi:P2 family phage contractile tail tube protein
MYDSNNMYAKVEEVNNPTVKHKKVEHKTLGQNGTIKLRAGLDAMTASFKLNGPVDEISADSGDAGTVHEWQFRGNLEGYKGQSLVSERPYLAIWRGTYEEAPGGNQKQHENIELTYNVDVVYYKLMIGGVEKLEIDVANNIHRVNGKDLLAKYRENLGL